MQFSWYIMYSKLTNGLEKCCLEQFSTCVFSVSPLLDFTGNQILLSLDQCPIMTNTFQQTFPWNATDKIHRVPPGWPFKYTRVVVFIWIQYKNLNNTGGEEKNPVSYCLEIHFLSKAAANISCVRLAMTHQQSLWKEKPSLSLQPW